MDLLLSCCRGVLLSFQQYAELCLAFGVGQARLWRLVLPQEGQEGKDNRGWTSGGQIDMIYMHQILLLPL